MTIVRSSYEVLWILSQGPYSHFIFFALYEWAQ